MAGSGPALKELLSRCARGEPDAQDAILRACLPRVRAHVHHELAGDFRKHHRWIMPLFSTGDIVQEVFLRVLSELADLDIATEDDLSRCLATLVHHRLIDMVRHYEAQRRDQRRQTAQADVGSAAGPVLPSGEPAPPEFTALAEQVEIFHAVLGEFSARHRLLLEMRLQDEATYAVIARELGYASEESARQAFVDAHARLLVKLRARGMRAGDDDSRGSWTGGALRSGQGKTKDTG